MDSLKVYSYGEKVLEKIPDLRCKILGKKSHPYQVELHLPPRGENLCWLNCKHCYSQTLKKADEKISLDRMLNILEEISLGNPRTNEKIDKIVLSGFITDPLNSDMIFPVADYLKKKNIGVGIHTKGIALREGLANLLVENNLKEDYISFSIDAGSNKTYNLVHGIKNQNAEIYARVFRNVEALSRKRAEKNSSLKIRATYLLTEENCGEDVEKFVGDFGNLGIDTIRFSVPIIPTMGVQKRQTSFKEINSNQISSFLKRFDTLKKQNKNLIYIDFPSEQKRVLPCFMKKISPTVGYDGYLYPCCLVSSEEFKSLRIADLKKEKFWDAYFKPVKLNYADADCQCDRKCAEINSLAYDLIFAPLEIDCKTK